jgi:hypothetical protein
VFRKNRELTKRRVEPYLNKYVIHFEGALQPMYVEA